MQQKAGSDPSGLEAMHAILLGSYNLKKLLYF